MTTTANINEQQGFILIIMGDIHLEVLELPLSSFQNSTFNVILFLSSIKYIEQRIDKRIGKQIPRKWLSDELIMFWTDMNILKNVLILISSKASDYCFVDKFLFTSYILYNSLKTDLSTDRDSTFTISRRGIV